MYNKEKLLIHIQKLKPHGFEILKNNFGYVFAENKRVKVIHLSTRVLFPHGVYIYGASAHIIFNGIEEVLKPFYLVEGVENSDNYTIKKSLVNIEDVKYDILNQEIRDDVSFFKIAPELEKLIRAGLLFFDMLRTIEDVAEFLVDKTPKEIVPWIQGAILFPKTILILRQANHPKFEEKRDEFYAILRKQAAKKKQFEVHLKVFEKLFC